MSISLFEVVPNDSVFFILFFLSVVPASGFSKHTIRDVYINTPCDHGPVAL